MADLEKAITTQEELDAVLADRLKRKDEQLAKKYGDYEDIKKRLQTYETDIANYTKQLEEANKKSATFDKTVADLNAKIKGYETDSVKRKIARETGIPYELAGRLSGETEEDIRKDAQSLAKVINAEQPAAPLASTEGAAASGENAAYKKMLDNLKGE